MFLRRELLTKEIHNNWLNKMIETNKAKQFIIYVKEDNRPIGSIFLKDIDLEKQTAEYGNFIGEEDCLGKGYGSEYNEDVKAEVIYMEVTDIDFHHFS